MRRARPGANRADVARGLTGRPTRGTRLLVRRPRPELDLLDAQDAAPVGLVPQGLSEHPLRLPARREELDHAVDLVTHDCQKNIRAG
jgi:hypothetical protein